MPELTPAGIRIGVAEDEADFRTALTALLTALGHEVVCAVENGAELIKCCTGQKVDVVIVDLEMPLVDGLETAEEFAHRGVPAILLSGHPDATAVNVDKEPIAARLLKPATLESLQAAIKKALAHGGQQTNGA